MKHVWIAYMYVYICNNLVYIIRLCYFLLIHKLYSRFQYHFCLYFSILIKPCPSCLFSSYHTLTLLIPRKLTLLKSVLLTVIWFLRQLNFSFDRHLKCLTE